MRWLGDTRARHKTWLILGEWTALFTGAFLRIYRFDSQKLWLDELYTLQVSSGSLLHLWRQATTDILPPLTSLPFWLSANLFGFTQAGIRLVSVIFALIALILFWRVSRGVLQPETALVVTWMFAISPLAVYYAQEARPYATGLAAAVFTIWAYERLRRVSNWRNWVIYAFSACVAGQVYMLNVFLVGGQLLALLILSPDRKRVLVGGMLTVLAVALTLGPFLVGAHTIMETWHTRSPIAFLPPLLTLANGDLRLATQSTRLAAFGVLLLGWVLALLDRRVWPALLPFLSQILVFIAAIFVVFPLLGRLLPVYDERAYLMLLPASLIGFGLGIQAVLHIRIGRVLTFALVGVFSLASFLSLWRYFDGFNKSPEGELAGMIAAKALPGDCALVNRDAYSVDAALRYYSTLPVYYHYREDESQWFLVPDNLLMVEPRDESILELRQIDACDRFWVVQRALPVTFMPVLQADYHALDEISVEPFLAMLLSKKK